MFHAPGATFRSCDFTAFSAQEAVLAGASLESCLLTDVSLPGADLREARLKHVDFRAGPGSRAGQFSFTRSPEKRSSLKVPSRTIGSIRREVLSKLEH